MKLHSRWGKAGFTLAEVLLTMTIVGVIAAMTIPTLHYQRVKKEYSAKLKNFYSKIDNAILDMEMDKGSFRDMTLPTGNPCTECFKWYMNNLDPYIGHDFVNRANIRGMFILKMDLLLCCFIVVLVWILYMIQTEIDRLITQDMIDIDFYFVLPI